MIKNSVVLSSQHLNSCATSETVKLIKLIYYFTSILGKCSNILLLIKQDDIALLNLYTEEVYLHKSPYPKSGQLKNRPSRSKYSPYHLTSKKFVFESRFVCLSVALSAVKISQERMIVLS